MNFFNLPLIVKLPLAIFVFLPLILIRGAFNILMTIVGFILIALGVKKENLERDVALEKLELAALYQKQMEAMNSGGCKEDEMPNGIGEFGLVPTNPIPANTPAGSITYLMGLTAQDGTKVTYERIGPTKVQNIEKPIDAYQIRHQNGSDLGVVYISPYQARTSKKAPKGFSLVVFS